MTYSDVIFEPSSSCNSGKRSKPKQSLLNLSTSDLRGMYSSCNLTAKFNDLTLLSSAFLITPSIYKTRSSLNLSKIKQVLFTALISACICLNSSTCDIFSCNSNSISCLYSDKHFSSWSCVSISRTSLAFNFSNCIVLALTKIFVYKQYIFYVF